MRVDFLHRRVMDDIRALSFDLQGIFPQQIPHCYTGHATNIGAFVKRMNAITSKHGIWNQVSVVEQSDTYKPGELRFCGEWIPKEIRTKERREQDIVIHWVVHPRARRITFTPNKWSFWSFVYWVYVMHELVHRHQSSSRNTSSSERVYRPAAKQTENAPLHEEQTYLGSYDEIEAHAHDIAFELLALYPNVPFHEAMRNMRDMDFHSVSVGELVTYPIYRHAFTEAPHHPVMSILHRKIRTWYRQLKQHRDMYEELGILPLPRRITQLTHTSI